MCHYLGVLFFLKRAELSFFRICVQLWIPFEDTCRIMGTILRKCGIDCQEEQRICKSCLMISLRFEEISLHRRNMNIFHQFCGIIGSVFSGMGGIMGHKFEPKWHVPVKIWLS